MIYYLDTEFIESGPTRPIYLLSIGIVAEDGRELYLQNWDVPFALANNWVKENVFPHMQDWKQQGRVGVALPLPRWLPDTNAPVWQLRQAIANQIRAFVERDDKPVFWTYFGDYDWVCFCQLFGTMMDLPKGWPMFAMDIKQFCVSLGDPRLPEQGKGEHNSLSDARWNKLAYEFLQKFAEAQQGNEP